MAETRRIRKRERTHQALMHSAKQLYEEYGIGNVTIDKIAENADVSRSSFFSHFESLDDLLSQIANQEIQDIIDVSYVDGKLDLNAVFKKLSEDTYPYPSLMSELVVRSILSGKESSLNNMFSLICREIKTDDEYENSLSEFSASDISSFIFGAYFGLVFRKIIDKENFENPDEINDKIQKFIKFIKNQEETK